MIDAGSAWSWHKLIVRRLSAVILPRVSDRQQDTNASSPSHLLVTISSLQPPYVNATDCFTSKRFKLQSSVMDTVSFLSLEATISRVRSFVLSLLRVGRYSSRSSTCTSSVSYFSALSSPTRIGSLLSMSQYSVVNRSSTVSLIGSGISQAHSTRKA